MMSWAYGMSGWIGMLLFWAFIILLLVFLVRALANRTPSDQDGQSRALDILNERYAKGEINQEEYEERRSTLLN